MTDYLSCSHKKYHTIYESTITSLQSTSPRANTRNSCTLKSRLQANHMNLTYIQDKLTTSFKGEGTNVRSGTVHEFLVQLVISIHMNFVSAH